MATRKAPRRPARKAGHPAPPATHPPHLHPPTCSSAAIHRHRTYTCRRGRVELSLLRFCTGQPRSELLRSVG